MRLLDVKHLLDDASLFTFVTLDGEPTTEERIEFDRLCRQTSTFDGWRFYGQKIDDAYVLIVCNEDRELP